MMKMMRWKLTCHPNYLKYNKNWKIKSRRRVDRKCSPHKRTLI